MQYYIALYLLVFSDDPKKCSPKFLLFVAISVRNLQSFHETINFTTLHPTVQMNTPFEESVQLSITALVWILAFRITDYYFCKYDQHKNFHWKMSSELVRKIHFCPGSDIAVNCTV